METSGPLAGSVAARRLRQRPLRFRVIERGNGRKGAIPQQTGARGRPRMPAAAERFPDGPFAVMRDLREEIHA